MKKNLLLLIVGCFTACNNTPKIAENKAVNADTIPVSASIRTMKSGLPTDSLVIQVDSAGHITMGKEQKDLETLESNLVDSLLVIKKQYNKLPDTILLRTKGDVLMGSRGAIKDVIMDAKEKVKAMN